MRIARSVAAVIAGIATFTLFLLAAMSLGGRLLGTEPEWINRTVTTQIAWLLVNVGSMALAGYVVACIARTRHVAHAVVMGAIQTLFTIGALIGNGAGDTPLWLWIGGMVISVPAAWAGATIRTTSG
jgi:hypothetical protein